MVDVKMHKCFPTIISEFSYQPDLIPYNLMKDYIKKIRKNHMYHTDDILHNVSYFLNLKDVILNANNFCRIPVCGAISQYNDKSLTVGPRINPIVISRRVRLQGFIVFDYANKYLEAQMKLAEWIKAGKVSIEETIIEGFENIPEAFLGLFDGKNIGKMIVKI